MAWSTSGAASRPAGSPGSGSSRSRVTSSSGSGPDRWALAIATVGGAGYAPVAPGTAGSLVAAVVLWAVPFSTAGLLLYLGAVTLVGIWAAHRAEAVLGTKDPGAIVVDEVAGMTLSVLGLPRTIPVLALGFLLFRLLDVVKPFPARASQQIRGGLGVMVDDLLAGLYTLGILWLSRALLAWP